MKKNSNFFKRLFGEKVPFNGVSSTCSSDKIQEFQSYYKQKVAKTIGDLQSYGSVGNTLSEEFLVKQKPFEECILSIGKDKMLKYGKDTIKQTTNSDIYCILSEILGDEDLAIGVREEIVDGLAYKLKWDIIKENLSNVELLDYEDILIVEIGNGDRDFIKFILNKGKLFTKKSMDKLINTDLLNYPRKYERGEVVGEYLEKFQGVSHKEIVNKLIETGQGEVVGKYLEKFQGVNHQEIANKLIETRQGDVVIEYLRKFQLTDYQEIIIKLIEAGKSYDLYEHNCRKELSGLKYQEIVDKLIEVGQGWIIIECKKMFKGVNRQKTSDILLYESKNPASLMYSLKFFTGKHQKILNRLNLDDDSHLVAIESNIDDIECLLSQEIAEKLCEYKINRGDLDFMIEKIDKFEKFSPKIAQIFILHGFVDVVLENPEKFGLKKKMNS